MKVMRVSDIICLITFAGIDFLFGYDKQDNFPRFTAKKSRGAGTAMDTHTETSTSS